MQHVSSDYADGFREGYTDFLDSGGTGQPPPLPPRRYWNNRHATQEGRQAVQDWFAGFRHGAAMARRSGAREYAMVPLSTPVASVNGIYVNRQSGPTAVTILTPPIPDPASVPPGWQAGGPPPGTPPDASLLPDSTRPFGLLPGALPTHNLPPTTLPPGVSPPGVQPVVPGTVPLEAMPPHPVLYEPVPVEPVPPGWASPEASPPDGLLPEPSRPIDREETGPAVRQGAVPATNVSERQAQAISPAGMVKSSVASLTFRQPRGPTPRARQAALAAGEASAPRAPSTRRAAGSAR